METLSKHISPDKSKEQFVHDAIVEPLIVVVYILSSIFIFSTFEAHGNNQYGVNRSEDWTLIDCTYFTAQTMSTVGYGDISPASKDGPRIFAVWMILVGIALVFPILGKWMIIFTADFTKWGRERMEILLPRRKIDIDGDGSADFEVPRHVFIYYSKNLLPSFFLCIVVQLISAGIFLGIENEQEYLDHADGTPCIPSEPTNTEGVTCGVGRLPWTYSDAFYHCVITATTVGYGDVRIATQRGRLFAAFHMVLSVAMVSDLLSTIGTLATERAELKSRQAIIEKRTDQDLFQRLMDRAKEIYPEKKHEDGITEYEYVVLMITELGIADWKDVSVFAKHFKSIDTDGSGKLTQEDMNHALERERRRVSNEMQERTSRKVDHKNFRPLAVSEKANSAKPEANSAKPEATGPGIVKKLNLVEMRLNMRFESTGREGSVERQCFTRDLKQDLANASGMETSLFNILKLSQGSVIVDMIAPETAAQEIQRQSLDPFSKLRSGKITTFLEKVCLQNGSLIPSRPLSPAAEMALEQVKQLESQVLQIQAAVKAASSSPPKAAPAPNGESTYDEAYPCISYTGTPTPCTVAPRTVPSVTFVATEVQHNNVHWPLQLQASAQLDRGYQHPLNETMPQAASATIGFSFPAESSRQVFAPADPGTQRLIEMRTATSPSAAGYTAGSERGWLYGTGRLLRKVE